MASSAIQIGLEPCVDRRRREVIELLSATDHGRTQHGKSDHKQNDVDDLTNAEEVRACPHDQSTGNERKRCGREQRFDLLSSLDW
jgi:hypothetical protein